MQHSEPHYGFNPNSLKKMISYKVITLSAVTDAFHIIFQSVYRRAVSLVYVHLAIRKKILYYNCITAFM